MAEEGDLAVMTLHEQYRSVNTCTNIQCISRSSVSLKTEARRASRRIAYVIPKEKSCTMAAFRVQVLADGECNARSERYAFGQMKAAQPCPFEGQSAVDHDMLAHIQLALAINDVVGGARSLHFCKPF